MYTKILVPLDGSKLAESVLPYVTWFTKVSNVNEIVFIRAVEPFHMAGSIHSEVPSKKRKQIEQDAVNLAREYLNKIAGQYRDTGITVTPVVVEGKAAKVVAEYVSKSKVDLIIMATHGFSGFHRWVRGSTADEILHAALVPVFLVKPEDKPPDK